MDIKAKLDKLYTKLELLRKYYYALGVINFDLETICPEGAKEDEGEIFEFFANESFKIRNSQEVNDLICELYEVKDQLSELDRSLIEKKYDEYLKSKNITPEMDMEMNKIFTKSSLDWHKAKTQSDYNLFKDSLKSVVEITRKAVDLRENKLPDFYDNLLNDCEIGLLQCDLDPFFDELKKGLTELIGKIKNSKKVIRKDFLTRKAPIHKQEEFSNYLLKLNGFDFNRGCISTTEHPFTSDVAKNDARVTTHYYEDAVLSNVYSVIHEGGHAIFMQNEPEEDYAHFINDYITNGMHESVSRFYENVIGRSKEYVSLIFPKFQEIFKDEFSDVTEREFYEAINIVEPSLIRTEADEVTYGLHIIIRYELEKAMCRGEISFDDLPAAWNKKYEEYLGVTPDCDKNGVLQDVHWSSGFGYFPSYAIGNAYNAMYSEKLKRDIDFYGAIRKGDFALINGWMKENVFKKANRLSPKEWIKDLTGEALTPKYFIEYLNKKYADIYEF